MDSTTIAVDSKNRRTAENTCERIRIEAERADWRYKGGSTDQAMIFSILDIAQLFGRLSLFWDARSASFAAGVAPTTASHSLRRLCERHWIIPYPQNAILPKNRVPKFTPNCYLVNPAFPHMYRYTLPNDTFPLPVRGYPPLLSAGEGASVNVNTGEIKDNLISILRDTRHTYTYAGTRSALLIGRTELGIMLGKPGVRLCLKADSEPRTIKQLAALADVDPSVAGDVIRKKLSPKGLLTNIGGEWFELATHPGGGWWERGRWVQGIPLGEYYMRPARHGGPNRVGRRLSAIASQRRRFHGTEDEWISAALADKMEP